MTNSQAQRGDQSKLSETKPDTMEDYGSIERSNPVQTTKYNELPTSDSVASDSDSPLRSSPPRPAVRQRTLKRLKDGSDQNNKETPGEQSDNNICSDELTCRNASDETKTLKSFLPTNGDKDVRIIHLQQLNKEFAQRGRLKMSSVKQEQESVSDALGVSHLKQVTKYQAQLPCATSYPTNSSEVQVNNDMQSELASIKNNGLNIQLHHQESFDSSTIEQPAVARPYPKAVFFIIANEFCERFSYYGLRTVLVLYLNTVLGFSESSSTVSFHAFATVCYMMPVLGAILGDSVWGKYKTILNLSMVYLIGEVLLVISSVVWYKGMLTNLATFFSLLLIGIGTGGIKPCVSGFGGDQFMSHETQRRQSFFSVFYAAINLGSLISTFSAPMLRSNFQCVDRSDCYPLAFAVPTILMFVSIIVFVLANKSYTFVPLPDKNTTVAFVQCVWLALKRKFDGQTVPDESDRDSSNTSVSSLTLSSLEDNCKTSKLDLVPEFKSGGPRAVRRLSERPLTPTRSTDRRHWIYLASDRYDRQSIEDFKSVLSILLLFIPIPVYWCLYDQQGSLWTLQAARMDGHIFNGRFNIEPDQMGVLNPLLLLATIPLFEFIIYPVLRKCNLLMNPIDRITAGGLLAALAFVVSSMIEFKIQNSMPPTQAAHGRANLIVINGLTGCTLLDSQISYSDLSNASIASESTRLADKMRPLDWSSANNLLASNSNHTYSVRFSIYDPNHSTNTSHPGENTNEGRLFSSSQGCGFNTGSRHEIPLQVLESGASKLLYVEAENGKLTAKMFDDSPKLAPVGKARVRLVYESFGSLSQVDARRFFLVPTVLGSTSLSNSSKLSHTRAYERTFSNFNRRGQVAASEYLDVDVGPMGAHFTLKTSDDLKLDLIGTILLKPGARNIIVVQQLNSSNAIVTNNLVQDNDYRINMMVQFVPYSIISISEVMFSITGLEFSYSMAPSNMKSLILGAWSLTTAFGNILTMLFESLHPFPNMAHDFLFYAILMVADMLLFAFIGRQHKTYRDRSLAT